MCCISHFNSIKRNRSDAKILVKSIMRNRSPVNMYNYNHLSHNSWINLHLFHILRVSVIYVSVTDRKSSSISFSLLYLLWYALEITRTNSYSVKSFLRWEKDRWQVERSFAGRWTQHWKLSCHVSAGQGASRFEPWFPHLQMRVTGSSFPTGSLCDWNRQLTTASAPGCPAQVKWMFHSHTHPTGSMNVSLWSPLKNPKSPLPCRRG